MGGVSKQQASAADCYQLHSDDCATTTNDTTTCNDVEQQQQQPIPVVATATWKIVDFENDNTAAARAANDTRTTNVVVATDANDIAGAASSSQHQQEGVLLLSRDGSVHVTNEVYNTASHLVAFLLSILGTVLLLSTAATTTIEDEQEQYHRVWKLVSFAIYGSSLLFLFASSALHHGISNASLLEYRFRVMDYMAIYPLIAGTFTPLCLVLYHDSAIGWSFAMTVWGVAVVGMITTAVYFSKLPKWLSMTLYITLGWFGGCMSYWLQLRLGWYGYSLFLFGGVLYTVGGVVFTMERPNPYPGMFGFHEIWHTFVVAAAFCHWLLMYVYILPYTTVRTTT